MKFLKQIPRIRNAFAPNTGVNQLGTKAFATSATTTYKLKYFEFRVMGEAIRWQFAHAGVNYEDIRLPRVDWDVYGKNKIGWGKLPILEVNGKEIAQSCAISQYLAKEFGQLPASDFQQAQAQELILHLQDVIPLWRNWVRCADPVQKPFFKRQMNEVHFPFYIPKFGNFIQANGSNGFAVGETLSYVDFWLANYMQIWTENHGIEILNSSPAVKAHMLKILNIPQIKDWVSKRPKTEL